MMIYGLFLGIPGTDFFYDVAAAALANPDRWLVQRE